MTEHRSAIDGVTLKPCPLCGGEACYLLGGIPEVWACCDNEGCTNPVAEGATMDEAARNWNEGVLVIDKARTE